MEKILTSAHSVLDALSTCLEKRMVFSIYRLPGQKDITLIIQRGQEISELRCMDDIADRDGFLIAPFSKNTSDKCYLIGPDMVIRNSLSDEQFEELESVSFDYLNGAGQMSPEETSKADYICQIKKTLREIDSGEYDKVVLSRVKIVEGAFVSHLKRIFELLCESYPNAFVYLFSFKDHCWTGATPEPLVCTKEETLHTVSLAGTRPYSETNMDISHWNHKELTEQEYVTKNIETVLDEYNIENYTKKGPYTKQAGRLIHLRTDFYFTLEDAGDNLAPLINALHPTSAICGLPKEKSLGFIKGIEKHNREYYGGFLGPVGIDDRLQLYVNLRCMKVLENELALFIGGGITNESVPGDEWEETEIKADTLLSVVQQIQ
ncbi:MAG: chorismate-binding protein [Bacteroidales bacterium]|jgi:isochorismate synthase